LANTTQLPQSLMLIFEQYLSGQAELLEAINKFGKSFEVTSVGWQFKLPDLYFFYRQTSLDTGDMEYLHFRQMLYQHPINQILSNNGGRFELIENRGHIDRNRYALVNYR